MEKLYITIIVLTALLTLSVGVNIHALNDLSKCDERLQTELDREW